MIRKSLRLKDETGKWIEKGASERKIGEGQFLDLVATWPIPGTETSPERKIFVAEELETPNSLLKITRDEDGLPVGFVRAKAGEAWKAIDWKRLEALSVEVQGLKRDKLKKEVELKEVQIARAKGRLGPSARHELEEQKDTASGWPWCEDEGKVVKTFVEEEYCRRMDHKIRNATAAEIRFAGVG